MKSSHETTHFLVDLEDTNFVRNIYLTESRGGWFRIRRPAGLYFRRKSAFAKLCKVSAKAEQITTFNKLKNGLPSDVTGAKV